MPSSPAPAPVETADPLRIWFRFIRLNRRATNAVSTELKALGLSIPQFDLLSTLTEREGMSQQELAERLEDLRVVIAAKAGEGGRLFGAFTSKQISLHLKDAHGIQVEKKKIQLEEPIRSLGVTQVPVKLHPEVTVNLSVQVVEE